ncbi:adenylosuccinate synthase [Candidatus Woesearchaeota archaeon]|nr:adenylosuccinate synthase [Candidatus Woesearchaeota archaeon]
MPGICVIGAQWGDEGKGKLVDIIGESADCIVRYQGGNNAGHTIVVQGKKYTFHALPAGVLRGKRSLIASEVVLDPRQLYSEMKKFEGELNLGIDPRTSIIMPWHNDLDNVGEESRKKTTGAAIGTTARGIGPCYEDDKNRSGLRFYELVGNPQSLENRIREVHDVKRKVIEQVYGTQISYDINKTVDDYISLGSYLKKYLADVSQEVSKALKDGKNVVFEGAQGTLLDIKFGNYPKVTSSHPMTGAVFDSVGIAPMKMRAIGIIKAYVTKVGSGPVVTCLDNGLWPVDESKSTPEGNYIRNKGQEKGTTTGRPRRVGWMDAVVLKYTHRLNGFSELALMKLDCLSGLDKVRMAVAYENNGMIFDDYPSWDTDFLNDCKPIYEEFDGFGDISQARTYKQLPKSARNYVNRIEELIGTPVTVISVGPGREETIFRKFKKF